MSKKNNSITNFIGFLKNDEVSLDAKSLYLIVIYSILVNLGYLISFIVLPVSEAAIWTSSASILFFVLIAYLLNRYDEIEMIKYAVIIAINFIIFPLLFYMTGALISGTVLFFPLGIVFTFFLLNGRIVYIFFAAELIWYTIILILPLANPERFANTPDMVFLDYMMPEMNGIDTLERIRKIPGSRIASMPVIALTANVVSGAREMFLEAGFDDFLAKPISIDKMERILRKYLRRELIVPRNTSNVK